MPAKWSPPEEPEDPEEQSVSIFAIAVVVTVFGGPDDDRIVGAPNRTNYLFGNEGNDTLKGGTDEDLLFGGEGNDSLDGDKGPDGFQGGPGDDRLRARDSQADLFFECGEGQDGLLADAVEDRNVNRIGCAENRFSMDVGGSTLTSLLPATSVATYVWQPGDSTAHDWLTAASGAHLKTRLVQQPDLPMGPASEDGTPVVEVDPTRRFQTIEGFGGAMTQAASLLAGESAARRTQMINALFSASGAHLNYVRVPIGATDLSTGVYDNDPLPPGQTRDDALEHFTVAHDEGDLIPALQRARAVNPALELMATPWSAPGWMKIGGQFIADDCDGSADFLRQDAYPAYALYFLKFLQAYRDRGLPVGMVSLQNEPHNCKTGHPTMLMKPEDQAHLANELRPLLDANGFGSTGILGWDHNWSEKDLDTGEHIPVRFPQEAVGLAEGAISAVGYHCYDKDPVGPEAQSEFHEAFSGTDVYFTECSGFIDKNNAAQNLVSEVRDDLIGPLNNWGPHLALLEPRPGKRRRARPAGRKRLPYLSRHAQRRSRNRQMDSQRGLLLLGAVLQVRPTRGRANLVYAHAGSGGRNHCLPQSRWLDRRRRAQHRQRIARRRLLLAFADGSTGVVSRALVWWESAPSLAMERLRVSSGDGEMEPPPLISGTSARKFPNR